eukprot:136720-Pelagomonas_calceolata.AAC.2
MSGEMHGMTAVPQEASMSNKCCATGQLAAELLPQDNGNLPPIVERINFWRMGGMQDFPVLAGVAVCLLCMHSLLHVPVSATGQLGASCAPSTALAWPRAMELIYVHCNSKHFTRNDLQASLQLYEEENR